MFADERRMEIVKLLEQQQTVTVSQLIERYGVSIETIRRDLALLEQRKLLRRVHGGAVSLHRMQQFVKLDERREQNREHKQEIAHAVLELLNEGDRIILDSGSTAKEIAVLLCEKMEKLTVITYSSEIFTILAQKENFHLIQIGGEYLRGEQAFYGHQAEEMLSGLHAQKAIVCPSALSMEQGVGDYIPQLIPLQKMLTESADEVIIAADSSKLSTIGAYRICKLSNHFTIVTDSGVPERFEQDCKAKGIPLKIYK